VKHLEASTNRGAKMFEEMEWEKGSLLGERPRKKKETKMQEYDTSDHRGRLNFVTGGRGIADCGGMWGGRKRRTRRKGDMLTKLGQTGMLKWLSSAQIPEKVQRQEREPQKSLTQEKSYRKMPPLCALP